MKLLENNTAIHIFHKDLNPIVFIDYIIYVVVKSNSQLEVAVGQVPEFKTNKH